jgi:SPP1 family phage portal protein
MITRDKSLLEKGVTVGLIQSCIDEFRENRLPTLQKLKEYYDGKHEIENRSRSSGLPNTKIVNGYPRYIVVMASSYLAGNPIEYTSVEQEELLKNIVNEYNSGNIDSVDSELAVQASLYGVGLEIAYLNTEGKPRSATIDPRSAFVVYDDTVEHNPLMGILWRDVKDMDGAVKEVVCDVYTEDAVTSFSGKDIESLSGDSPNTESNFFDGIPIIEFWNNSDETGDFESVLSLIDAYDILQSDRVNDKQQFVDSLLVFTGISDVVSGGNPDDSRSLGQRLREDKAIALPDRDAQIQWVSRQMSESDTQTLSGAINADIHKMSMIPDLTDQNFAGNSSGVAMRYKLLGLEQLTKIKERWFREALRQRLRLYVSVARLAGARTLDINAVRIIFTRALPLNETEIAQTLSTLHEFVPEELLLQRVPFIDDGASAKKMLDAERVRLKEISSAGARNNAQEPPAQAAKPEETPPPASTPTAKPTARKPRQPKPDAKARPQPPRERAQWMGVNTPAAQRSQKPK